MAARLGGAVDVAGGTAMPGGPSGPPWKNAASLVLLCIRLRHVRDLAVLKSCQRRKWFRQWDAGLDLPFGADRLLGALDAARLGRFRGPVREG